MAKKLIAVLVANLFATGYAWAADEPFVWTGSITAGGRWVDSDGGTRNGGVATSATTVAPFTGPADEAKLNEYRDLRNTFNGVIDMRGGNRANYLFGYGENFGLDDQYIDVRAGGWGVWKGAFYMDRIPHNLSWNALTPLGNPGGNMQLTPPAPYPPFQNPATWNTFNYGTQRNTTGGTIDFSNKSPWFVRADYNEVTTTGVRPGSAQLGTGSGNGLIEFGMPTDYKTKNSTLEAGYADKTWSLKLGFLDSRFSSGTSDMWWTNFYMMNAADQSLQPQGNDLQKWSFNLSARDLPWDSTFSMRATYSTLTSDFGVLATGLKPAGNQAPPTGVGYMVTTPTSSDFNGEHITTTVALSLASTPLPGLDTRLYYSYYDKDNNSTPIGYAAGALGPAAATCPGSSNVSRFCLNALEAGEPFSYTKNNAGIDATYRLGKQKFLGGYDYLKVERTLEYADETEDNRFWLEYRNTMLQNVSGRLKYTYLQRRSNWDHAFTAGGTANPNQVAYYYSAYDVSNNDQNEVKFNVDWSPVDLLTVSFGIQWRQTDYKDLYYGRKDDKRTLYDASISYGDPDRFRVTLLGNWGEVEFNQAYHQGTGPYPNGVQTATDFDWGTKNTQGNWLVALSGDWRVTEQIFVTASYSYQKTDGGVDFWSGNYAGTGGFNGGPLVNYNTDNTKTQRFNIKGDYAINKNWSAALGYAYEKYDYSDDQMRGYQGYYPYYQNLGGTNNSWFSGAFANPSYKANIVYLTATYRFQ